MNIWQWMGWFFFGWPYARVLLNSARTTQHWAIKRVYNGGFIRIYHDRSQNDIMYDIPARQSLEKLSSFEYDYLTPRKRLL